MSELLEKLDEQINIDRDLIKVLPRNGIRAIKELSEKVNTMKKQYQIVSDKVLKEIEERYDKLIDITANRDINRYKEDAEEINEKIIVIDERDNFEKMQLDKLTYHINGYYKKDLETINKEIIEEMKIFEKMGIKLKAEDFNVSNFAEEYMKVLIAEAKNGEINSEKIKEIFDKIYWKCSDVISHIYVCFRNIYDRYQKEINEYYTNSKEEIFSITQMNQQQMEEEKKKILREKNEIEIKDDKTVLNNFMTGIFNINDFKKDFYESNYDELISKEFSKLSAEDKEKNDANIANLYKNVQEYAKFMEYRFLVDDLIKIKKEEKDKLEKQAKKPKKTEKEIIEEQIYKNIEKIFKINEKTSRGRKLRFFEKNNSENSLSNEEILERNNIILEIKKLYLELDDARVREKVMNQLDETATFLDFLKIASYYYNFMAKSIIKKYPEITDKEIDEMILKIRKFVEFTDFNVINNINAEEQKELSIIIKDKYRLYGINLSKDNFNMDNIEDLIKKISVIYNYNNIMNCKLTIEEIDFILKAKEIIKK